MAWEGAERRRWLGVVEIAAPPTLTLNLVRTGHSGGEWGRDADASGRRLSVTTAGSLVLHNRNRTNLEVTTPSFGNALCPPALYGLNV